jgi:hypothetical protein
MDRNIDNLDPSYFVGSLARVSGVLRCVIPNKHTRSKRELRQWQTVLSPVTISNQEFDHLCVPNSVRLQEVLDHAKPGDRIEFVTKLKTYEWGGVRKIGLRGAYVRNVKLIKQ